MEKLQYYKVTDFLKSKGVRLEKLESYDFFCSNEIITYYYKTTLPDGLSLSKLREEIESLFKIRIDEEYYNNKKFDEVFLFLGFDLYFSDIPVHVFLLTPEIVKASKYSYKSPNPECEIPLYLRYHPKQHPSFVQRINSRRKQNGFKLPKLNVIDWILSLLAF